MQVRRRHPYYPSERVEVVKYEQPAALAHSDYTPGGAIEQLKGSFPGQEAYFLDKEFDMIKSVLLRIDMVVSADELEVSGNHWWDLTTTGHWLCVTILPSNPRILSGRMFCMWTASPKTNCCIQTTDTAGTTSRISSKTI